MVTEGGDDLLVAHLDLIFKWMSLRLCEKENPGTLARLLEVLEALFVKLQATGYELADAEAAVIVPSLLDKYSGPKDRSAEGFKRCLDALQAVYPHKKFAPYPIKALKAKSGKTVAANILLVSVP